jgi:hypothetical protein
MHALPALKQAALEAFETEDGPGDLAGFFSLVDPQSVLELVEIAETPIVGEEARLYNADRQRSQRGSPTATNIVY